MFAFFMVVISASIFSIFITEAAKKLDRTTKVKIYNSKVRKYRDKAYDELLRKCKNRVEKEHSDLISIDEIAQVIEMLNRK